MDIKCRICLEVRGLMVFIFEEEDQFQNLAKLLLECGGLKVHEDDCFPKFLCQECTQELLMAAKFREKCSLSIKLLQDYQKQFLNTVTKTPGTENQIQNDIREQFCGQENFFGEEDNMVEDTVLKKDHTEDVEVRHEINCEAMSEETIFTEIIEQVDEDSSVCNNEILVVNDLKQTEEEESIISNFNPTETNLLLLRDNEKDVVHDNSSNDGHIENENDVKEHSSVCTLCGASFVKKLNLQRHIEVEHRIPFIDIEKKQEVLHLSIPKTSLEDRTCKFCGKCLQSAFSLRTHLRTHTGERPFGCEICNKNFKTRSALDVHIKRHSGEANFVCEICNKRFYEQSNLSSHLRSHTDTRPHVCSFCNKSFTRVFLLQVHMRTHTGERPYQCEICNSSFKQSADLKCHLALHSGKRNYQCNVCSKGFIKPYLLQHHMTKHHHEKNSNSVNTKSNSPIVGDDNENSEFFLDMNSSFQLEDLIVNENHSN